MSKRADLVDFLQPKNVGFTRDRIATDFDLSPFLRGGAQGVEGSAGRATSSILCSASTTIELAVETAQGSFDFLRATSFKTSVKVFEGKRTVNFFSATAFFLSA